MAECDVFLIENPSQFLTHWPYINSTFGSLGGKIWALSKEVTDPDSDAISYGYVVFRRTIYDEGIAAFQTIDYGHPQLAPATKDGYNELTHGSVIDRDKGKNASKVGREGWYEIFGGSGSYVSEDSMEPEDGESFQGLRFASTGVVSYAILPIWRNSDLPCFDRPPILIHCR